MATSTEPIVSGAVPMLPGPPLVTAERSAIVSPLGWSAIFAGTAVAVGVWPVLHMLGIGIGLTAIDPDDARTLRGVGIGAGVWSAIAPIVALFVGGLVAGRMAPTINTANAAIHGAVVWAVTGIASVMLIAMAVGSALSGAASAGATVSRGAAQVAGVASPGEVSLGDLGLSGNDLLAPINERLRAESIPPLTADQLDAAARDALSLVVCGPPTLMPPGLEGLATVTHRIDEAVEGADVVMMLRIQLERMQAGFFPSLREYARYYGLDSRRLALVAPDAIVMHPGPINRGVEIMSEVADGSASVILEQVANGVAVRMAVLYLLAGGSEREAAA